MAVQNGIYSDDVDACVDRVIERVGKRITLGLPLGLGKPIRFANALYQRARQDPDIQLHIVTALSLLAPEGGSSLEKRFMEPFAHRLYGRIPELAYARDALNSKLPANVTVSEFFFKAGSYLNNRDQQCHYVCTNYTHAVRDLMAQGINVVAQLMAPGQDHGRMGELSFSCNPDLSLDILPLLREREARGTPVAVVGELNRHLPWFGHQAAVAEGEFDVILSDPHNDYPLFPAPQMAIQPEDHLIGFYASTLLKDGGTLQVGIGSLGAALVYNTILRHRHNPQWQALYDHLKVAEEFPVAAEYGGTGRFERGLYGCSEMFVDGFLYLMQEGILKREVFDDARLQELINDGEIGREPSLEMLDTLCRHGLIESPLRARDLQWLIRYGVMQPQVELRGGRLLLSDDVSVQADLADAEARQAIARHGLTEQFCGGVVMHGGFFVGPDRFYQELRELTEAQRAWISMTSVNYINHLYDHRYGKQRLKTAQRVHSRFINTAMMQTLTGAAVSDGLDDGRVVSGVGGQYNFVSMAHELPGARSVLVLRATRQSGGETVSNLVFNYGHCTIPRHLRDLVITEYGIADLRGRNDEDVVLRLIRIADSRFQDGLLRQARKAGKVRPGFRIPAAWRNNTPAAVKEALNAAGEGDWFPAFPFGRDFTDDELTLAKALTGLKTATASGRGKLAALWQALRAKDEDGRYDALLERMALLRPSGVREKLDRKLLIHGLDRLQTPDTETKARN